MIKLASIVLLLALAIAAVSAGGNQTSTTKPIPLEMCIQTCLTNDAARKYEAKIKVAEKNKEENKENKDDRMGTHEEKKSRGKPHLYVAWTKSKPPQAIVRKYYTKD